MVETHPTDAIIYCDGASRGNPGIAAYGYVIYSKKNPQQLIARDNKTIGVATNNVAEYQALLAALKHAVALHIKNITIFMDSQLIVRQMRGEYRTKNPMLKKLNKQAVHFSKSFTKICFQEIPRQENKVADALANQALNQQ